MNLIKEVWIESDRAEFIEYLESLANLEKVDWTRKILNTKLDLLAITSPVIKGLAKEIAKGNFVSFLDLNINDYHDSISLNGLLITKIKSFSIMESYLIPYSEAAENWANCDLLEIKVNNENRENWWALAGKLIKNEKLFARRVGIIILFKFVERDEYINKIFAILAGFYCESEYYVNMVNSWLIAECFIKQRDKTLEFFESRKLNAFTVNKAVAKCRDSFRVSADDKEMLLQFKVKQ